MMIRTTLSASRLPATLVACGVVLTGCGSGGKAENAAETIGGGLPRQQLVNIDNGLMVRKWVVADQPEHIAVEISRVAEPLDLDAALVERLERNGFRLLRIAAHEVDALVESLGGTTQDQSEWLGQAPLWQPLHQVGTRSGGQAVAVDGKVARYDNGSFRLMARAWTMPMEDGPFVQVEVLPEFRTRQTVNYREMLEGTTAPPHLFPSMAMTLEIQPGDAYVLVGSSPQQVWPGDERSAAPRGAGSRGMGGAGGPGGAVGPDTAAPKTLGEVMMFSDSKPPMRGIMVFVAKIPQELFPAGHESALARNNRNGE